MKRQSPIFPVVAVACVLAGAAGVAAAAPEPPANRGESSNLRQCIDPLSASSWTPYDDHTILVHSGGRDFQITTNRCPRLADPLARISTRMLGGSSICSPHDVQLLVSDGADTIAVPCFIQSITPLTADQAKALESRRR
jgi:hypothetical protein